MNQYLKNLKKIEFVVTNACTGRCKHCSQGDHNGENTKIDPKSAAELVRDVAKEYEIKTVMAFGGEPLLHPESVYAIHSAARDCGIARRQLITNGYFSNDPEKIAQVVRELAAAGVNDILLSVDAFHQETIPVDTVRAFATLARDSGIPTRLQPAWLNSKSYRCEYNLKTREVLDSFSDLGIPESDGNIIFPEGNALKFLSEHFVGSAPENPYVEDPGDLRCISIDADGGLLGENIYRKSPLEILEKYKP